MRPIIVGEDNPYSLNPDDALAPFPRGAAGDRLRRVLRLTDREYLRSYHRANLCLGRWRAEVARRAADELIAGPWPLILLGAKVCRAFDLEYRPFRRSGRVLVLPHPSGRCRAWNDPGAAARARRAVRRLLDACGRIGSTGAEGRCRRVRRTGSGTS